MNLLQTTMNYRGCVIASKNVPIRSPLQLQHNATYCIIKVSTLVSVFTVQQIPLFKFSPLDYSVIQKDFFYQVWVKFCKQVLGIHGRGEMNVTVRYSNQELGIRKVSFLFPVSELKQLDKGRPTQHKTLRSRARFWKQLSVLEEW